MRSNGGTIVYRTRGVFSRYPIERSQEPDVSGVEYEGARRVTRPVNQLGEQGRKRATYFRGVHRIHLYEVVLTTQKDQLRRTVAEFVGLVLAGHVVLADSPPVRRLPRCETQVISVGRRGTGNQLRI